MIKSITMKNIGSYKEETKLILNTPITLIYGNNGAGKTLLSNYLLNITDEKYKDCLINGLENTDNILVYNQKFIEENFYENKQQKGIFTLSKENKEINEQIEKVEAILSIKNKEKTFIEQDEISFNAELFNKTNNIKTSIYQFKQAYANDKHSVFKDFFDKIYSKDDFFEFILKFKKVEDTSTIEELEKQLKELKDYKDIDLLSINEIYEFVKKINIIEQNNIFNEIILGSSNKIFSAIITKLNNIEWVEKGYKEYLSISDNICPFCQQQIDTNEITRNLREYFDNEYNNKKEIIIQFKQQYENIYHGLNNFISNIYSNTYIDKIEPNLLQDIKGIYYNIRDIIEKNINMINQKLSKMSSKITLDKSDKKSNEFIQQLNDINNKIKEHNKKVKNILKEKEVIKIKFFNICRKQYDTEIKKYISEKKDIEHKINFTKNNKKNNEDEIKKYQLDLQNYRKDTKISFKSIENINNLLQEMGILNFKLEKIDNNFYKIKRDNEETEIFKTLSEGEKMIISFLYFLERCKGIINDDEIHKHNKLIVIDDPISSLSFEHIFTIASTIKHIIIEPFILENKTYNNQLLILTHNLYFFHEFYLLDRYNKELLSKINSYRIFKNNNLNSKFEKINKDDILNDYQALWKILKDYKKGNCNAIIIPNTMRNILEYFSAFIHNKIYKKIIEQNKNKIFNQTFCRYINRKSHSDKYNISFNQEFCPNVFMENFEKLFKEWGFEDHYNAMMGIDSNKTV